MQITDIPVQLQRVGVSKESQRSRPAANADVLEAVVSQNKPVDTKVTTYTGNEVLLSESAHSSETEEVRPCL